MSKNREMDRVNLVHLLEKMNGDDARILLRKNGAQYQGSVDWRLPQKNGREGVDAVIVIDG